MDEHRTGKIRRHLEERRIADATLFQDDPRTFDALVGLHGVLEQIASAVGRPRNKVLWSGTAQIGPTGVWHHRMATGSLAAAVNNPNGTALTLVAGGPGASAPAYGAGVWQVPANGQVSVNAPGPVSDWTLYGAAGQLVTVQLFGDHIAPATGGGGGPPGLSYSYVPGQAYGPPGVVGSQVFIQTVLSALPFPVQGTHTFVGLGMWITTAGVVGTGGSCVIRLGAYRDAGGYPGELIVDAGTVDATTTGMKTITGLSIPASQEVLYLAAEMEGANITSVPQCLGHPGPGTPQNIPGVAGSASDPFVGAAWTTNNGYGTGPLPATFPPIGAGLGEVYADGGSWGVFLMA